MEKTENRKGTELMIRKPARRMLLKRFWLLRVIRKREKKTKRNTEKTFKKKPIFISIFLPYAVQKKILFR